MTGTVELKRAGTETWIAAGAGASIEKSTVISTGFRSTAILAIGNSTITVRPLTRLSLEELINQNDTETVNVNLNAGRVRVQVTPPAGGKTNFTVQGPSSTASVRGTSFEMDPVSIRVIEGAVSYAPSQGPLIRSVTVGAGQESRVDTVTGMLVIPLAASQEARALPVLAGQSSSAETAAGSPISIPADDSLEITIGFER